MLSLLSKAQKDAMLEYESLKLQVKTLQEIILNNENTISLLKDSLITKEE